MYVFILSGLFAALLTALVTEDYEWEVVSKHFISHCIISFSAAVTLGALLLMIGG